MLDQQKSRALTVLQLFEVLQEEYIVCLVRIAIYPIQRHKDYWQNTANLKKDKIIDIARKNQLLSIFDDKHIYKRVRDKLIPEIGYPKFCYKNEFQELQQGKWDVHNYFSQGAEIVVYSEEGIRFEGKIIFADINDKSVKVVLKSGEEQIFSLNTVTRPILHTL